MRLHTLLVLLVLPSALVVVFFQSLYAQRSDYADLHASREALTRARVQEQLQAAALNDSIIQEREGGIANIHRTVQEVSEIFQDLALLVDEQGAHIDNIQTNIESAGSQTAKGVQQLAKASRSQKKNRGRLCCCAVTLLIGLVALVLVLKFATGAFGG